MDPFGSWRVRRWLVAAAACACCAPGTAGEELARDLREALEAALRAEVARIGEATDEQGRRHQRAHVSTHFRAAGDEAYHAGLIRDTAGDELLTTERFRLTLRRSAGSGFEVGQRELLDTYARLRRSRAGDERFFRFASFAFEREGLRVSATNGSAILDATGGEVDWIALASPDLGYVYRPPATPGQHKHALHGALPHQDDFVYAPEVAVLTCDPTSCRELLDSAFSGLAEGAREALDPALAGFHDRRMKEQAEARQRDPFSGFELPDEPDRRRWAVELKKSAKDHWIRLQRDSASGWEVEFSVPGYGTLYGYPAADTLRTTSAHEIERRDDAETRLYDLRGLRGTVDVAVRRSELLSADLTYTLQAKRPLREIPFRLNNLRDYLSGGFSEHEAVLRVDALEAGDGEELTWVRTGSSAGLVVLPAERPAGAEIVLRMAFETEGSILKLTPSYSYMDRSGWLPFVQYADKIDDFELTLRLPSRYKALGVGTKVEETSEGALTRTRWLGQGPVHFPTIIFGDYFTDAPRTRAEKSDGSAIPVEIHVDKESLTDWEIRPKQLRPLAEQAVNALNVYRTLYGVDYPYGKLDLVNDLNMFSGQAPASIVYLGSAAFRGEGTLGTFFGGSVTEYLDTLVAHEVAHQWWGSLIGNANARSYWFVESLAEYSSALFVEILESNGYQDPEKGRRAYLGRVDTWRREYLERDVLASVQDARTLWSNGGYFAALYAKGPYAFHILRTTIDDDRKFFGFLGELAQELAGREIVTRDIQRVAERALGGIDADGRPYRLDLEWFFDQWIRGVGIPEYGFEYATRQTEDGAYLVQGEIRQRVVAGKNRVELKGVQFRGVVPVTVTGPSNREYPARVLVEKERTPFAFKVPEKPVTVTLNKYGEILAHPVRTGP
jgi:hypothetical protein